MLLESIPTQTSLCTILGADLSLINIFDLNWHGWGVAVQLVGCVPDVDAVIDILMDVDLTPAGSAAGEDVVMNGGLYPRLSHGGGSGGAGPAMNGGGGPGPGPGLGPGPGPGPDPFSPPRGDGPPRGLHRGGSYEGGR